MNIPNGTMPGKLVKVEDYDNRAKKMRKTNQNTFFSKKFGRNDFELLPNNAQSKAMAIRYITKYLGKSKGKIVYSRGLPMYVISDINREDVLANSISDFGEKLVLYDKFDCFNVGEYLGSIDSDVKKTLRKSNR